MKTAYRGRRGYVMVPFDSLDIGEVVKVVRTATGDSDTLIVTKGSGCAECPYVSTYPPMCTMKWIHGDQEVPLCIPRRYGDDDASLSFKLIDNIMEDI